MHTLIIEKTTNLILQSRYDNSTGEKMPIEQVLQTYCADTNTDVSSVEVVEIPFVKFELIVGKHIYKDGQIQVSPTWVEPIIEPTPVAN